MNDCQNDDPEDRDEQQARRDFELTMILNALAYPNPTVEATRAAWGCGGLEREAYNLELPPSIKNPKYMKRFNIDD